MSLVDTGMVPFIDAYPLVISLGFVIVAGNMLMVILSHISYRHRHQPNETFSPSFFD